MTEQETGRGPREGGKEGTGEGAWGSYTSESEGADGRGEHAGKQTGQCKEAPELWHSPDPLADNPHARDISSPRHHPCITPLAFSSLPTSPMTVRRRPTSLPTHIPYTLVPGGTCRRNACLHIRLSQTRSDPWLIHAPRRHTKQAAKQVQTAAGSPLELAGNTCFEAIVSRPRMTSPLPRIRPELPSRVGSPSECVIRGSHRDVPPRLANLLGTSSTSRRSAGSPLIWEAARVK